MLPSKKSIPACWFGVRLLSSARTGLGGKVTCSAKVVKSAMSDWSPGSVGDVFPPTSPEKAPMKFMNDVNSLVGLMPKNPSDRSPRQCIGPLFDMPRSV